MKQKKTLIALATLALVIVLGISLSIFYLKKLKAMTEDDARSIAANYLPEGIHFITSDETKDEFELIYFDDREGRSYRVEVGNPDGQLHSIFAQAVMAKEGSSIKIQSTKIKEILESEFQGATLENYSFKEGNIEGMGSIEVHFEWSGYNGVMHLNPETGLVISYSLKRSAQVVIPVGQNNENSGFLTEEEASLRAGDIIASASILDLELELQDDRYVYEIYASDEENLYVLSLDAETGERIRLQTIDKSRIAAPTGEKSPTSATTMSESESTTSVALPTATSTGEQPKPTTAPTVAATPTPQPTQDASPTSTEAPQAVITLPTNDDDWDDIVKYAPEISRERAAQIALGQVSGAGPNHVVNIDFDEDDGLITWEIEINYQGVEYEILVHAGNGTVLEVEVDD